MARATFAMANAIQTVPGHAPHPAGAAANAPYYFDEAEQHAIHRAKPWASDPGHFTTVHISAVALIKMAMHARSGGALEIMGTLQGKLAANAFIITDTFPVPVVGTETRVNAVAEGYEFMVGYQSQCGAVGRRENVVGWYHSHPGYGCWLSGIDVETQRINQQYQDPFLAIVVDPVRTQSAGKVELGAFRTYPTGYVPPDAAGVAGGASGDYQSIPSNKVEDFGVHCQQYYSLDVRFFQSTLDGGLLDGVWNRYWAASLSSSPLVSNREYVASCVRDLGTKMGAATEVAVRGRARGLYMGGAGGRKGIGGGGGGSGGRSKGGGGGGEQGQRWPHDAGGPRRAAGGARAYARHDDADDEGGLVSGRPRRTGGGRQPRDERCREGEWGSRPRGRGGRQRKHGHGEWGGSTSARRAGSMSPPPSQRRRGAPHSGVESERLSLVVGGGLRLTDRLPRPPASTWPRGGSLTWSHCT